MSDPNILYFVLVIISALILGAYVSSLFTSRVTKFKNLAPKRFNDSFLVIPGIEPIEGDLESIQGRGDVLGSNTTVIKSKVTLNGLGTISNLVIFRFKGNSYLYEEKHYLFKSPTTSIRMLLQSEVDKVHQGLVSSIS